MDVDVFSGCMALYSLLILFMMCTNVLYGRSLQLLLGTRIHP